MIVEPGSSRRLNGPSDERHYFNGDFGWMRNLNHRYAFGGTVFVGALSGPSLHVRVGVRPRVRFWLSKKASLDGSLGPFVGPVTVNPTPEQLANPELTTDSSDLRLGAFGQISLNLEDRISFLVLAEALSAERASDPQPDVSVYLGSRLGSTVGVVGLLAAGVLLGVAGLATSGL